MYRYMTVPYWEISSTDLVNVIFSLLNFFTHALGKFRKHGTVVTTNRGCLLSQHTLPCYTLLPPSSCFRKMCTSHTHSHLDETITKMNSHCSRPDNGVASTSRDPVLISSLATETLQDIFLFCVHLDGSPESLLDASWSPILLSHVSRYWRELALSMPRLWNTLFLCGPYQTTETYLKPSSDYSLSIWLQRLQIFLHRSETLPLTIYFDLRCPTWSHSRPEMFHPFTIERMSAIVDILIPHISRWESVEILSDTWSPLYIFLGRCSPSTSPSVDGNKMAKTTVPRALRRLSLSRCNAYFSMPDVLFAPTKWSDHFALFGGEAPLLKQVLLAGVHVNWINSPIQNLTELSLKYHAQDVLPSLSQFITILRASPRLEKLSIYGWAVCSLDETEALSTLKEAIHLPQLYELALGWVDAEYTIRFFSLFSFRMPRLRSIALEDIMNNLNPITTLNSSAILDDLSSRLTENLDPNSETGNVSNVEELTVHGMDCTLDSCSRFMCTFPNLRTLALHNTSQTFLTSLQPPIDDGSAQFACPVLSRLELRDIEEMDRSEAEQLLEARQEWMTRTGETPPQGTLLGFLILVACTDCEFSQLRFSGVLE